MPIRKDVIMKLSDHLITFSQGDCIYRFLPSGDIFSFTNGPFLINQFRGTSLDGSVNNIYLRIFLPDRISTYPLLGIRASGKASRSDRALRLTGRVEDISYTVTFRPENNLWFWDITLSGTNRDVDLIYGQDLGISAETAVYTNELYTSQYLGHSVFSEDNGYVVCSRQNLPSHSCNPYVQQGTIGCRAIHYSTDGLQFFGLSCKETGTPAALSSDLEDTVLQYEFAYIALQTEKIHLNGEVSVGFYGMFLRDHPDAVTAPQPQAQIFCIHEKAGEDCGVFFPLKPVRLKGEFVQPLSSLPFSAEEIDFLFPRRSLEEIRENALFSFFTPDHAHVVTKEKELLTLRPHGTILITPPDTSRISSSLIASTQYMFGVFHSHVAVGNTDRHKLFSSSRGFLNLQKHSGLRIYIRQKNRFHMLCLPGLYEMGMNYSRWFYKTEQDTLIVTAYAAAQSPDLFLTVTSRNRIPYDFIVTGQVVMGTLEYAGDYTFEQLPDGIRFYGHFPAYPQLHYDVLSPDHPAWIWGDGVFLDGGQSLDGDRLSLSFSGVSGFSVTIRGHLDTKPTAAASAEHPEFEKEKLICLSYYEELIRQFSLDIGDHIERISILNETVWWYAHNALIHFAMPHGLEQTGGAAWGTRDVCQGPMEFFLATQHYELARDTLLRIFSHQSKTTQEWPQWFMFDRYSDSAGECHGDVIFWPLKSVADYLEATGDYDLLAEEVAYADDPECRDSILSHIELALSCIIRFRLLPGNDLITYAGGDWDDTLQPASETLKENLVSSWTVALAYQTFRSLDKALAGQKNCETLSSKFSSLADRLKMAFQRHLIRGGVIAGFWQAGQANPYMLHPLDSQTGIHYRLLPMTRSIIAELVNPAQAQNNAEIIATHLKFPDGVRLMDRPARYQGGICCLFRRAEQAANVGREISLQYTHAHIRYIEAMAKLGYSAEAWESLFSINPILIGHTVPNAGIRQSNLYFSSSDGAFHDRYEYERSFDLLRTGSIRVNGGWRLYSSGPGIYLRQLIENILGIRFSKDGLIIDPQLPRSLDGLRFRYRCFGKIRVFQYHLSPEYSLCAVTEGKTLSGLLLRNPYRQGGLLVPIQEFNRCGEQIDIYIPC